MTFIGTHDLTAIQRDRKTVYTSGGSGGGGRGGGWKGGHQQSTVIDDHDHDHDRDLVTDNHKYTTHSKDLRIFS